MTTTSWARNILHKLGSGYRIITGRDSFSIRILLAQEYLRGRGLEVGALDKPLQVPASAKVSYVDRMTRDGLLQHYPELAGKKLVSVDIVSDGETLEEIGDSSQDFVIANHFLEHCQDFIGTLKNFLRVIRTDGVLFIALPDKRYTFDRDRQETSYDHLLKDHHDGPAVSRSGHFHEWVRYVEKKRAGPEADREVEKLMAMNYSIHFHVFTAFGFLGIIERLRGEQGLKFEVVAFLQNGDEFLCMLRKQSA